MDEFFRGWRRKIGLVSLMMALSFMGGWIRSFRHADIVQCIATIKFPFRRQLEFPL